MEKNDNNNRNDKRYVMDLASPIYDLDIGSIYKTYNLLGDLGFYSSLYDDYYHYGLPLRNQRTASLLNNCAQEGLDMLRHMDPELYDKLNNKLPNVAFLREHGDNILYKVEKPKGIPWKTYCCLLLDRDKSDYKQLCIMKIINLMLAWKYVSYTIEYKIYLCLMVMSTMPSSLTQLVVYDSWGSDDYFIQWTPGKKNPMVSLSHLPDQPLESEVYFMIEYLYNNDMELLNNIYNNCDELKKLLLPYIKSEENLKDMNLKLLHHRIFKKDYKSTLNWRLLSYCVMRNDYDLTLAGEKSTFASERFIQKQRNNNKKNKEGKK